METVTERTALAAAFGKRVKETARVGGYKLSARRALALFFGFRRFLGRLDVAFLLGRREDMFQAERLEPELPTPAFRVKKMLVLLYD